MTDQEINETIAEKCGYLRGHPCDRCGSGRDTWLNPQGRVISSMYLPNYARDRNAIYEAIQTLSPSQKADLAVTLARIMGKQFNPCGWIDLVCDTTARQYAEAFLRTFSLWKD